MVKSIIEFLTKKFPKKWYSIRELQSDFSVSRGIKWTGKLLTNSKLCTIILVRYNNVTERRLNSSRSQGQGNRWKKSVKDKK